LLTIYIHHLKPILSWYQLILNILAVLFCTGPLIVVHCFSWCVYFSVYAGYVQCYPSAGRNSLFVWQLTDLFMYIYVCFVLSLASSALSKGQTAVRCCMVLVSISSVTQQTHWPATTVVDMPDNGWCFPVTTMSHVSHRNIAVTTGYLCCAITYAEQIRRHAVFCVISAHLR